MPTSSSKPYTIASSTIDLPLSRRCGFVGSSQTLGSHRPGRTCAPGKAVQDTEQFWGIPFPVDACYPDYADRTIFSKHPPAPRDSNQTRSVRPIVIHHEVAHYYFRTGPSWLDEGGATYIEEFFVGTRGNVRREAVPTYLPAKWSQNLQDLVELGSGPVWNRCRYPMGLNFLVALRKAMGNEAWLSALRAIYLEFGYERLFNSYLFRTSKTRFSIGRLWSTRPKT